MTHKLNAELNRSRFYALLANFVFLHAMRHGEGKSRKHPGKGCCREFLNIFIRVFMLGDSTPKIRRLFCPFPKEARLILVYILIAFAGRGQEPGSAAISINVYANVSSTCFVEISTLQHLSITGAERLSGELYISPQIHTDAGLMQLNGEPGSTARVSFLLTEELRAVNGNGRISMYYKLSGNAERIQNASTIIDAGEVIVHFGETGRYYLWIGGLADLSRAQPGIYKGQFTIEVEYI